MGDIQTRPFSKNYSGLINQSVIAVGITVLCVSCQEYMKRKRRLYCDDIGLGSRESWEFGYLFQGRSWAKNPSPPSSRGWPLAWVKHTINFPEDMLLELRGIDATLYIRFLRACFWYSLLHALTTFLILFPVHVKFSGTDIPPQSMTRSSITSLVATNKGLSLLWIHICLLFWVTLTWIAALLWVCNGAFTLRARSLGMALKNATSSGARKKDISYHPHPHPQYGFTDMPIPDPAHPNKGLRLRTVMVTNIPHTLRYEKDLKEYFQYYMCRKLEKPSIGITSSTQPGFFNKFLAFLFIRAKRIPAHLPPLPLLPHPAEPSGSPNVARDTSELSTSMDSVPVIDRVVIVRKMTELASLLERREEVLRLLETAHIKLANKTLTAVKAEMDRKASNSAFDSGKTRTGKTVQKERSSITVDAERGTCQNSMDETASVERLVEVLGPYVQEFGLQGSLAMRYRRAISTTSMRATNRFRFRGSTGSGAVRTSSATPGYPPFSSPSGCSQRGRSIWDALHALPRNSLDTYQPLVNLNHLFRGKIVPAIDYYTAKFNLLSSLITDSRAKPESEYDPVSTAFVTFADSADAKRACKYLAVHPNNPLACLVTMAPMYQDLDWKRVMKSSFKVDFVKDWVVDLGVWAFTLFWLFPVSLLVGLVSIQNISLFLPTLKAYLDRHAWENELIQSFLPTFLVALLALLIPLILLLIAKKAHNIMTLSALHDRIMTRYYKFLIVNVLVFFCIGTAALQSFLRSFSSPTRPNVLNIVADSFPSAGPFYVGWLIFTTGIHGGFELALFGLPLIMYPNTRRQVTPRKRAVGVRPRTLNFYYWLPNHLLVMHVLFLFAILNPFILPFGALYFFTQTGVIKYQLIHVYAKNYEANGQVILVRIVRYSLDGLVLAQAVFLAYMVVLKKVANVGLAAVLIISTSVIKILMTRMCRAQFEKDDIVEAKIVCGTHEAVDISDGEVPNDNNDLGVGSSIQPKRRHPLKLPAWMNFSYTTHREKPKPYPALPQSKKFSRLPSPSKDVYNDDLNLDSGVSSKPSRRHETLLEDMSMRLGLTTDDLTGSSELGPVVVRPPPVAWDDQTTVDLPYDNPFYTRPYSDVLWLPDNPCGILNMDDTVDLKVSLTTDISAGQMGTWLDVPYINSPLGNSPPGEGGSSTLLRRQSNIVTPVDGTEDIDLPPVIAMRVRSREDDVEQAVRPKRPSMYYRQVSGGDKNGINMGPVQRLSQPGNPIDTGIITRPLHRARSSTSAPPPSSHIHRIRSTDQIDHEPDSPAVHHAQTESPARGSGFQESLPSRTHNVSARVAIAQEVVAEEEAALVDRIEDEQSEAHKVIAKSWLTSWMFK